MYYGLESALHYLDHPVSHRPQAFTSCPEWHETNRR